MSKNTILNKVDVLSVGLLVADVFGKPIDDVPAWGRLGTFAHIEHHCGGCAVNTAVDLVRLGLKAAVAGAVGKDTAGTFIKQTLSQSGIEVDGISEFKQASTAYTFIMIAANGQRRYLHHLGANACLSDGDIPDSLLARARMLHIGGAFLMPQMDGQPTAKLLQRARNAGLKTSLDTAYNPNVNARSLIEPCLPYLDIFIPSIEEAELITGLKEPAAILDFFAPHQIPILGIKLGKQGCIIRSGETTIHYPAYEVEVVDTSGAGDAFMAGFLYGILQNWTIENAATFANAAAAFCVQAVACSTGIRPAQEILKFIQRTPLLGQRL